MEGAGVDQHGRHRRHEQQLGGPVLLHDGQETFGLEHREYHSGGRAMSGADELDLGGVDPHRQSVERDLLAPGGSELRTLGHYPEQEVGV